MSRRTLLEQALRPIRLRHVCGAAVVTIAAALVACGGGGGTTARDPGDPSGGGVDLPALPAGFPSPRIPADAPVTAARAELGRHLFFDIRLSGNGRQACASCHQPDKALTDGRMTAIGSTGQPHPRNTQSLLNVVFSPTLTWANPSLLQLEKQMEVPLFSEDPVEMGINDGNQAEVLARLRGDSRYPALFRAAFPDSAGEPDWSRIITAISAYQRTLYSGDSRYDRFLKGALTLTASEQRGLTLFFEEKAECFHCHGSFNFNDQIVHAGSRLIETPFNNTGLYNIGGTGAFPVGNRGVFELTEQPRDMGKFRAPSLRNVALTAPYMHDGTVATLEDVLDFYAAGGRNITEGPHAGDGRRNPNKSGLIGLIQLSTQDKADLIAFLRALTDLSLASNPALVDPWAGTANSFRTTLPPTAAAATP